MGILFISHSSKNNERAIRVRDWLREQGWRDTFLDLDPEHGLAPGQRWQDELKKAGARCSAVIVLVSPEWAASRWCVTEFLVASQLRKDVFPVLIAPTPFADLPPELAAHFQMADMSRPENEADGLNRLRIGLTRAGLHPGHFPWPPPGEPNRPPYRGLHTLEEPDAAIFFGRDALIAKGFEALRQMRDGAPERMLVVLGASGAGKSSFLRAGLLARLQRDEESFLVLPILRPARAALSGPSGLGPALGLSSPFTTEAIAARFAALRAPVVDRMTRYAQAGRETYTARPPTLILPIDQSEELFAAEQKEAGGALAALAAAFAADENLLAIVTIRSDGFAALQAERTLAAIPRLPLDLPALSPASFKEVVEGPGRLAEPPIKVEEALTSQLVADLDRADALPLLAFTLERLVLDHGADGVLTLDEYHTGLGGLHGAIGKAVEAAFSAALKDDDLPGDRAELERLVRSVFIPWLVRLERPDAVPQRRVATMRELPAAAQPMVRHFINQRLLVSAEREDGETTVEVPHEAVLRHWQLLADWLGEEGEGLARCYAVMRAAGEWRRDASRPGQRADLLLVHRGERLTTADRLLERDDLAKLMGPDARAYLAACREAETAALDEERRQLRRQRRWQRFAGVTVLVAFAVTFAGAWLVIRGGQDLSRQQSRFLAIEASSESNSGRFDRATRLAILAARDTWRQPASSESVHELGQAVFLGQLKVALHGHQDFVSKASFSPSGERLVTESWDGTARVWYQGKTAIWSSIVLDDHKGTIHTVATFSPDGRQIVTGSPDGIVQIWSENSTGQWTPTELNGRHDGPIIAAQFSEDGARIATAGEDGTVRMWHERTARNWIQKVLIGHWEAVRAISFSPGGTRIVSGAMDGDVRVWSERPNGEWTSTILEKLEPAPVLAASFSHDGTRVVAASMDGKTRIWREVTSGKWADTILDSRSAHPRTVTFSPDDKHVIAAYDYGPGLWREMGDGSWKMVELQGYERGSRGSAAQFSSDGSQLIAGSDKGLVYIWQRNSRGSWNDMTPTIVKAHEAPIRDISFSSDADLFATASEDGTVRVWRTSKEDFLTSNGRELNDIDKILVSQDWKLIVTYSDKHAIPGLDTVVRIWLALDNQKWRDTIVPEGVEYYNFPEAVSVDGRRIIMSQFTGSSRTLSAWTRTTGSAWSSVEIDEIEYHSDVVVSDDGRGVATRVDDGNMGVWSEQTDGKWAFSVPSTVGRQHVGYPEVQFSPEGDSLLAELPDDTAQVWYRTTNGAWSVAELQDTDSKIADATFFQRGDLVVTASANGPARIWNRDQSGHWSSRILAGTEGIISLESLSPDGTLLLTEVTDIGSKVWRDISGNLSTPLKVSGDLGRIRSGLFSPSGSWMFIVTDNDTLQAWYLDSADVWNRTNIGRESVDRIWISPDGSRLLILTNFKQVVLWDISRLLGDAERNAAAGSDPKPSLEPPIDAVCSASLAGTERIVVDTNGNEIRRESVRRLTAADTDAAPILRGREGEDVCAWQPSLLDRWLNWVFRDLWRGWKWAMPPPS